MSDRIRWGIMGTASVARKHFIPALAETAKCMAVMVGSRDRKRARVVADRFDVPNSGSYDDLVASRDVDAIYICLPNSMHVPWILRSLDAGKAVLCEKPLAVTAQEAELVHEKSVRTGIQVMEGLMYRFHPQNVYVLEQLKKGSIGEVIEVRVRNEFRLLSFIRPDNIRLTDGRGAGALMDIGCYVVSASRMLYESEPVRAFGRMDYDDGRGTDIGFAGMLEYPDRRFAQINWSFRSGHGGGYSIVGAEATMEVPYAFIPGAVGRAVDTVVITVDRTRRRFEERFPVGNQFRLMIESFADALIQGVRPRYETLDAWNNAKALELVRDAGIRRN